MPRPNAPSARNRCQALERKGWVECKYCDVKVDEGFSVKFEGKEYTA